MTQYKIFQCPRCGTFLYCPDTQKTKKCPSCQKNFTINRLKILKFTNTLQDAVFLIKNLKVPAEIRDQIYPISEKPLESKSKIDKLFDFIKKTQKASKEKPITDDIFIEEALLAGFSKMWVIKQLEILEKQGLLLRPSEDEIQFII